VVFFDVGKHLKTATPPSGMDELHFITSSGKKYEEVRAIIPNIQQMNLELPEIQSIDARAIIEAKLLEARKYTDKTIIVEDTSLHFDCINGLPGPLIKWFLETLKEQGLAEMAMKLGNTNAVARTIIGYSNGIETRYFEGSVTGQIVYPRATQGFGWDLIFIPEGCDKTCAEMTREEKNAISWRGKAARELKTYLETRQ